MSLNLTPLPSLRLSHYFIPSHLFIPNSSPHSHHLLIYHRAFPPSTSPSTIESHLPTNGLIPQWRYTMYSTSHFHSTTHEVLCIYSGRARLMFGGDNNPGKVEVEVGRGHVVVVPAGVAHRLVEDLDGDGDGDGDGEGFQMVGSYPKGCSWDMCYGKEAEGDLAEKVKGVKWFERDPIYGEDGPVLWGAEKVEEHQRRVEGKTEL